MSRKESTDCSCGATEVTAAVPFDQAEDVIVRLQEGPGEEARRETAAKPDGPPPSRWTLRSIRATFEEMRGYTLSGIWYWLHRRVGVCLRSGRVQHFSPDPEYRRKVRRLKRVLREAAKNRGKVVVLFLDEMGYSLWPDPAADWGREPPYPSPQADRRNSNNGLWRVIAAVDALSGRVLHRDNYIVGRREVVAMYKQIAEAYPRAKRIYVVQDNWSIHVHPDVLKPLKAYPKIKPVWLPTYAPWLNPIEKLWRWLKESILKMHRLADAPSRLRERVIAFLDQFARGSKRLLKTIGLLGKGQLAKARACA